MAGYDSNAQTEFNGLWQLVKDHEDQYGLMQWELELDGKSCKYADSGTPDGATDGDLDIGYGLVLADKQWGGYSSDATWNELTSNPVGDHYYGETIKMLVYLVMAGDYWNPAS